MLRVVCSFGFPNLHANEDSEANLASLADFKKEKGTGHLQVLKTVKKAFHVNSGKNLGKDVHLCPHRGTPLFSPVTMSQARISKSLLFVNGSESELATAH